MIKTKITRKLIIMMTLQTVEVHDNDYKTDIGYVTIKIKRSIT